MKLLLVLILIAFVIYGVIRGIQRQGGGQAPKLRPRPPAPDDDPDFLRDLDRRNRPDDSDS